MRAEAIVDGQTFGIRTVIGAAPQRPGKTDRYWLVRCRCGDTSVISTTGLKKTTSCTKCQERTGRVVSSPLERLCKQLRYEHGCWVYTGYLKPDGYPTVTVNLRYRRNKRVPAYRAVYIELHGEIAPGLEIDHICRNRACVNPMHLEPVSHQKNVDRGANARGLARKRAA